MLCCYFCYKNNDFPGQKARFRCWIVKKHCFLFLETSKRVTELLLYLPATEYLSQLTKKPFKVKSKEDLTLTDKSNHSSWDAVEGKTAIHFNCSTVVPQH